MIRDLKHAFRMLAKNPGFALVVVGLLSIGIGSSAVIFSAVDKILLRPLPVRDPEELVRMVQKTPQLGTRSQFPFHFYRELRERSTALGAVFGETQLTVAINEPGPAEVVQVRLPTPEFFEMLGVPALYGRALTVNDAQENSGDPPAVLSYGFWHRRFGGDPAAVGRAIVLRRHRFVIVGVMPSAFNGVTVETSPDVRVPLRVYSLLASFENDSTMERNAQFELAGRLKSGATRAQAQTECLGIWRQTIEPYYRDVLKAPSGYIEEELNRGIELDPLERGVSILRDRFGGALRLLLACTGLLLMMMCANVAGLLTARNARRQEEIAIRLALGATRVRLVWQMLIESFLLTAGGAAGGLAIAAISAPLLVRALPPMRDFATTPLTVALELGPDWRVFLFSLVMSALTVLLFGLVPAFAASRVSLDSILRGARSSGRWRGREVLVIFQMALCTLLLAGAALLVRTFYELQWMDPGFDRDHVMTFTVNPGLMGYTNEQTTTLRMRLSESVRELPGVVSTATALIGVMRGSGLKTTVAPKGQRITPSDSLTVSINDVSVDYFRTLGMQILAGRGLMNTDSPTIKPVRVVVNNAFARRFFPGADPVGKLFGGTEGQGVAGGSYEIAGVVSDAKYRSLREPMTPTFYTPSRQSGFFQLLVRTDGRPESLIKPIRQALASLDPALPFSEIHALSEELDSSMAGERMTAALASIFGVVAALLTGVGVYGLLAQVVIQRQREISIRMALGARPGDIARLFGRQALVMVASGVILGLSGALLAGPWIRSLLYGIAPSDPTSLGAAAAFVVLVAGAATAIPTMHAVGIEPATALRQDN